MRGVTKLAAAMALGLAALGLVAVQAQELPKQAEWDGEVEPAPEPLGYRMADYRAAVPATLTDGTVLNTEDARDLIAAGEVVVIDVLPRPPKPKGLKAGTIWRPRPRHNIPGSIWLPNTGYGALAEPVERYFRGNLARLTGSRADRPLLFYCLARCWMSWNAARRAISYGYTRVYWYPEGSDGWVAAGLPTAPSQPVPQAE